MNCISGAESDTCCHAVDEMTQGYEECTGGFEKIVIKVRDSPAFICPNKKQNLCIPLLNTIYF